MSKSKDEKQTRHESDSENEESEMAIEGLEGKKTEENDEEEKKQEEEEKKQNKTRATECIQNPRKIINIYVEIQDIDFGYEMEKYDHYDEITMISDDGGTVYFLLTNFFLKDIILLDGSIHTRLIKTFLGTKHFKVYDDKNGNFRVDLDIDENNEKLQRDCAYIWTYISRRNRGGWVRVNAGRPTLSPAPVNGESRGVGKYSAVSRDVLNHYKMLISEDRRMTYKSRDGELVNTPSASVSFEIFGLTTGLTYTLRVYEGHLVGALGNLTMEQLRLSHVYEDDGPIWLKQSSDLLRVPL